MRAAQDGDSQRENHMTGMPRGRPGPRAPSAEVAGRLRVPAKVNLVLDVGARRADGYHEVRTVLQAVTLFDDVHVAAAQDVTVSCATPALGPSDSNLAWRAAMLLRSAAGVRAGVHIRLRKRIPVSAGLGGGSADAAATLVACARLWGLNWGRQRLAGLAAQLGADVPFFLWGGTALASGRGERIQRLPPLPPCPVVLVRPVAGSPTPAAYAALDAAGAWSRPDPAAVVGLARGLASATRRQVVELLAAGLGNSFEAVLLAARPDIVALRDALLAQGALGTVLCGSGSAVCALAPSIAWSHRAAAALRERGAWAYAARFFAAGVGGVARA